MSKNQTDNMFHSCRNIDDYNKIFMKERSWKT